MNQFKTRQEAELAAQVLTDVLNNPETIFYMEGQTEGDTEFYPVGDHWEVDSTIDFFIALCYWQRLQDPRKGRRWYGDRPSWSEEAIAVWKKWKTASPDEYERIQSECERMQRKADSLRSDYLTDVANAERAGYRWSGGVWVFDDD